MIAAGLVGQLQTIVSRRVSPMDPSVVSVGSFHAGSAPNIIPGTATLTGTVRTLSEKVRARVAKALTEMAESYARAHGGTAEVKYQWGSPACVNDGGLVDFLTPAAAGAVGSSSVLQQPPEMGGEDFAYYAKVAPTAFALIGSGNKELESDFPHHHPRFTIDERALGIGLRFMLESVERTSGGQAKLPVD
jgi:amidohydrolase